MSRLNELIVELCPNGVQHRPLWEVTIWDKKFNSVEREKQPEVIPYPYLLASDMFALQLDSGNVFLLSTGEQTGWTSEELAGDYLCEGEVVTIPWGKSRAVTDCIKYYKGKFVTADNRIATSRDTNVLLNKYLYYWMMSQGETIDTFYRGAGIQHPSMKSVLDMQIPLPPLPVQNEIVRILDNFTELTAELTTELTTRKKQYEYYRDHLLTFSNDVPQVALSEYFTQIRNGFVGTATPYFTTEEDGIRYLKGTNIHNGIISDNDYCYITPAFHQKHIRNELKADDILVVQSGHVGECAVVGEKYAGANCHALIIMSNGGQCSSKFVVHYLHSTEGKRKIAAITTGGTVKHILASEMKKFKIPFPPIAEQQRIVALLDRFDSLCNDITLGLPAEIEARKKQYEYYRDKLLSFEVKQ
jgi:type I restriction enzyme S subunit